MKTLISHLLGDTRTAILAALLLRPEERLHVRELARLTGISPGTLHRELIALTSLGVLHREVVGKQVFFAANRECTVFEELAGLLRKTAGLVDVVREALQPLADRISAAFVYGSVAAGAESARSDVDLMIVGGVSFGEAIRAVEPVQGAVRREVNPTVMKRSEFLRKREAKDGFVSTVWKSPKLWVIGSEHELG